MYNLIVGAMDGVLGTDRLLEVIDDGLEEFIGTKGAPNVGRLLSLPTLLMPETGDSYSEQVAQVGNVVNLDRSWRNCQFQFLRSNTVTTIPSEHIASAGRALKIGAWDLTRTRWSVKDADLYQSLVSENLLGIPSPKVFNLPRGRPEPNRIAVMMPFGERFDSVWKTLRGAAEAGQWNCQRADDIWQDSVVINDVVALISASQVVICDVTDRNPNVFYEAGIAHTLGREVVPITQNEGDIPFDLAHHRYIRYTNDKEGLAHLTESLLPRLRVLMPPR